MLMTSTLMSIMVMISILMVGCNTQPPPIPVPPSPTPMPMPSPTPMVIVVDERLMVIESLTRFNNASNNIMQFINSSEDIYTLGGNPYHTEFLAARQIILGLRVYNDVVTNWLAILPQDNEYYDKLIEIKKAELYRVQYFSDLLRMMVEVLPTEDDEMIRTVRIKFTVWGINPKNQQAARLQNDILEELNISAESVNFLHVLSKKSIPSIPPLSIDSNQPG